MLFLMRYEAGSKDYFYFVIDFFNDVTGIDRLAEHACDLQSKSSKNDSDRVKF